MELSFIMDLLDATRPTANGKTLALAEAGFGQWRQAHLETHRVQEMARAAYAATHEGPRIAAAEREAAFLHELKQRRANLCTAKAEMRRQALREWIGFAASADPLFVAKDPVFTMHAA
jgi:hypothetical protein